MSLESDRNLEAATAALASLTEDGIPPDVQELLVHGDPSRGIRPGALSRAIKEVLRSYIHENDIDPNDRDYT